MEASILILPVTALTVLHFLLVGRRRGLFNVDGVFVMASWIMTVGTLWLLDDPVNAAPGYAAVITIPFLIYLATSALLFWVKDRRRGVSANDVGRVQSVEPVCVPKAPLLMALFMLSFVITIAYFMSVGYNVFILGLQGLVNGQTQDYTTLRVNSYSSNRYLFPGYVNQFKNIILPTLSMVWAHWAFVTKQLSARSTALILGTICVFALLGTGQRGAFVIFALTALIYTYRANPKLFPSRAIRIALFATPLMLVSTYLLGRSSASLEAATSPIGRVTVLTQEIVKRFMFDNQWSGTMAYRFIEAQPTQWGREWIQGVMGILPGNSGSPLARQVFSFLYQTDRGTAPISMWGSVYYNFDWFGLVIFPVVLAVAWGAVADLQNRPIAPNALEVAGSSGFAAVAGGWIAGGPEQLLNAGAVTFAVLWMIGTRLRKKALSPGGPRPLSRARAAQPSRTS